MITLQEIIERDNRPPSVSVEMFSYNHEKYIDEAIRSVLMQKTDFPVNIVIHDDASPDGSADIIRKYAAENPNITSIIEETNFYQNGKSYFPVVQPYLTGKYIALLECDDFWIDEHKLQMQVDYLERSPDCSAVYANIMPVNKHSVRDENARYESVLGSKIGFPKTEEGDYPLCTFGHRHQIGTLVYRNIWQFMTQEEINIYLNARCTGDYKLLALFSHIGRVHYFAEELSAYRRIFDEGTSYTARMYRLSDYDKYKNIIRGISDTYIMIERLFGKKYYRKYFQAILHELKSHIKYHRSIIQDAQLDSSLQLRNIPWYMYVSLPFYILYKVMQKIARKFSSPK